MKAQIIAIGDEILMGQTIDTNSNFLATQLTQIGFDVEKITVIHDNKQQIIHTLNSVIGKIRLAIFTGGLGPTIDDITKQTFAEFFNSQLILNKEVLSDIKNFLIKRNIPLTKTNIKQAYVPVHAKIIRNKQGTAPGMWFEKNDTVIISLPGVPYEMKKLFLEDIIPMIKQHFKLPIINIRFIHTYGLIEAQLTEHLQEFEKQLPANIKIAYLPSPEDIKIRLTAIGNNKKQLDKLLDHQVEKIKHKISEYIFGYNNDTLPIAIKKLLHNTSKTISTAESCTGGNIAKMITSVSGSSEYFKGSIVAYSNELKISLLNIKPETIEKFGAVSKQTVIEMAEGVKKILNTDYAIATSGIAGPTGGTIEKPVGTVWIAISSPKKTIAKMFRFGNNREINIRRSSAMALFELYKFIKQQN